MLKVLLTLLFYVPSAPAILAGGEFDLPAESPSSRLDAEGAYDFTGFGNLSIHHDLSLLYFDDPLPSRIFPTLGNSLSQGDTATLVGFGRSGYGSYGYTTDASLTDRRVGYNVIDELADGLFRYDFDDSNTGLLFPSLPVYFC